MATIQLLWAHPRADSLTGRIARAIREEIIAGGVELIEHDLQREGFDPVMHQEDEPDWENVDKVYSEDINRLASDLLSSTAVIMVFPVYWFGMPALMKGYIDRVWNHGIA
ncbi:NAD(P)H-dependent oxidoreductase [Klebsiella oxytoca]|uniref:NAD(P)H-dependent oxidoreductase n=1 Tax=Klebsiella oxytoca TaxID=571 RepID=UPI003570F9C8